MSDVNETVDDSKEWENIENIPGYDDESINSDVPQEDITKTPTQLSSQVEEVTFIQIAAMVTPPTKETTL